MKWQKRCTKSTTRTISLYIFFIYLLLDKGGTWMDISRFRATSDDVAAFHASQEGKTRAPRRKRVIALDLPRPEKGERFIQGPIPISWITAASACGYRGEAVALAVWFAASFQKSNPAKLTNSVLAEFGVNARTARRCLERMEECGLVAVETHRGRSPIVTLLGGPKSA